MILADFAKKCLVNTKTGDAIVNVIRIRGIDEKLYTPGNIIRYCKDRKNPTDEMLKTRQFYEEHSDRVRRNIDLLYDPESKECYKRALEYRYTHDMSRRPKYSKDIYFVKDIFTLSSEEVLVDGGAFVGDTVRSFRKLTNNRFRRVICFEPDTYNFSMLSRIEDDRIIRINKGLSDHSVILKFFNNGSVGSRIIEENSDNHDDDIYDNSKVSSIQVVALDEMEDCRDASLIKMDIEGAELSALHGAKGLIMRNKPKLAICLYHSDEDMLSIIEYVHELVPEYKLYVRQHSLFAAETVLYAKV